MFSRIVSVLRYPFQPLLTQTSSDFTQIILSILKKIHSKAPLSKGRQLAYVYLIVTYLRFMFVSYILLRNKYLTYFEYDLVAGLGKATSETYNNPNAVLCAAQFNLIIFYIDYLLYGRPDEYVWPLVADWMLVNPHNFYKLTPGISKLELTILKPAKSYKSFKKSINQIKNSKKHNFAHANLPNYCPRVSGQIRATAVIVGQWFQFTFACILQFFRAFAVFFFFAVSISLYLYFRPPLFVLPLVIFDLFFMVLRIFYLIRLACFLLYTKWLLAYIECCHLTQLNQMLQRLSIKYVSQYTFWYTIGFFRREHTAIGVIIQKANHRLVSPLAFIVGCVNVAYNLVTLSILLFRDYPLVGKLPELILCCTQAFVGFTFMQPLILPSILYHAPGGTLIKLQARSFKNENVHYLQNKLKLMTTCELVNTDHKLYFTAGPMGDISYANAGIFILKYLSYFLFIVGLLDK